eukprot:CAMPEP_0179219360 /NCGR_PEP_ID=MMETSP0797-20121207/4987_1 /TAXON_ID=47934 /ORGANISM="Dinophysis acuminata, Strain DAEP01" /LENGTH=232 /DNA_ID=CAMNT_0020925813 /DNA_START=97 /DNA_END=795 /DNA_ORIENTATION=+
MSTASHKVYTTSHKKSLKTAGYFLHDPWTGMLEHTCQKAQLPWTETAADPSPAQLPRTWLADSRPGDADGKRAATPTRHCIASGKGAHLYHSEPVNGSSEVTGHTLRPKYFNSEPPNVCSTLLEDLASCSSTRKVTKDDAIALGKKARQKLAELDTELPLCRLAGAPKRTGSGIAVVPARDHASTADKIQVWHEYQRMPSVHPLILSKLRLMATLANGDPQFSDFPNPRCMA